MPSIAIVGGGPAGLTLARLLLVKARAQNIKDLRLTILEHDASADARWQQGGTHDLHTDTGIAALKAADMWEDILPRMRYDAEELIFADRNATYMLHVTSAAESNEEVKERPEVDREVLKQYLLKSVEEIAGENAVTWGKHLQSADGETGILKFKDGSEAGPFDLVVGADGAWSHVRNVLCPDEKPSYSGVCGFETWVDKEHSGENWDKFTKFVGKGSFFAFSNAQSVMMQRMEDGSMKLAFWVSKEAGWPADLVKSTGGDENKIRETLLTEFSSWDDQYKQLLRCSWHFRAWPLYELPVGHSWTHKKGFTMIGDSAHLMTPFAGEGVNAAMKDALELSNAIMTALRGERSLDAAIEGYEQESFPRNRAVQAKTAHNKSLMFRADAPISCMTDAVQQQVVRSGYDVTKGWMSLAFLPATTLTYLYFWSIVQVGAVKRAIRGT